MPFSRRGLLAAAVATPLGASAIAATTDLAVSCDLAAAPAVIAAATAFRRNSGVRVRVFPTANGLLLAQLQRDIQNDIIVTQLSTIAQAEKVGIVAPGTRGSAWRNRLVIAAAATGAADVFAVPDASPASDIDGFAIVRHLGSVTGRLMGVVDTGAVAWTLANGAARQGLLHQTEVLADNRLRTILAVPDEAWPPIVYGATVTKLARRGDPAAFVSFLDSPDGAAALLAAGLEPAA